MKKSCSDYQVSSTPILQNHLGYFIASYAFILTIIPPFLIIKSTWKLKRKIESNNDYYFKTKTAATTTYIFGDPGMSLKVGKRGVFLMMGSCKPTSRVTDRSY